MYGCEVWGFSKLDLCNRFQLRFLKLILGLNRSTPTCMVLGEVGCYPVDLEIKYRMLSFWYSLHCQSVEGFNKISCMIYRLMAVQKELAGEYVLPWLKEVHLYLDQLGLSFLKNSAPYNLAYFKSIIQQRLRDQFVQSWRSTLSQSNVYANYRLYKENFCFEKYLILLSQTLRKNMSKFRLNNHRLPIQQGRTLNVPLVERICTLCNLGEIGDEFHYLFVCEQEKIKNSRKKHLSNYFLHHCNILKFKQSMNTTFRSKLIHLESLL